MTGWKQRKSPANNNILPNIGCTCSLESFSPNGVSVAPAESSTAPRLYSRSTAWSTTSFCGGLMASSKKTAGGPSRSWATSKHNSSNGERNISGNSYSSIASHCSDVYNRNHFPGRHRPERPRRWKPFALAYHTVRNAETLESSLKKVLRLRPVSITNTMSSTVMDVSARIVDTMTFRLPAGGGWKMACCSAVGIRECSGMTCSW
mmetsp:Transcript_50534/g.142055  ORF Transcript_50534/g.142055 Transcript_50534/m.142055 type:complete len:205 (-) Transcript_50534:963-1577(-)